MTVSPLLEALADRLAAERFEITRSREATPYLTRWTLSGRRFEGSGRAVFLHRFHRSDADADVMHDHPWPFTSIILAGGYYEVTPAKGWSNGDGPVRRRWYGPGRVLTRPAEWIHRVEIPEGRECWTLILRGVKVRSWGFWCPSVGYRPWRMHLARADRTGRGCG
jgi:hypothetical protein